MPRPYYAEYVNHMMRFYATGFVKSPTKKQQFRSEVDRKNWTICESIMLRYEERERNILLTIYSRSDTLGDNIYELAKELHIDQSEIWQLVTDITRRIAKARGLI